MCEEENKKIKINQSQHAEKYHGVSKDFMVED